MNETPAIKPVTLKLYLYLGLGEGLLAFTLLFIQPSDEKSTLLLGYSLARLLLGALVLGIVILLGGMAWRTRKDASWLQAITQRLDTVLVARDWLIGLTFLFFFLLLFLSGFILLFASRYSYQLQDLLLHYPEWMARTIDILRAAYTRSASILFWFAALLLQVLVLLAATYPAVYLEKWRDGTTLKAVLVVFMIGLSVFHWSVLLFQLKTFMLIPGWKWYITPKDFQPNQYGLFMVLFFLTLILIGYLLTRSPGSQRSIAILIVLGYALQVAFGFITGGGFETIRLKYADSIFNGYAWAAADQPNLFQALTHYETVYGQDRYLGTKPPGVLIPYVATEKLASLLSPSTNRDERFYKITLMGAYLYPLIAFLVLGVLAWFSRRLLARPEEDILPAIVYILCPNVILIPMFMDQVLYPLLFMLVLAMALWFLEYPSFIGAFLVGAAAYIALYFTFSLLAMVPFVMLWLAMDWLRAPSRVAFWRLVRLLLGVAVGVLAMLLFFRLALNYDIFIRYFSAFSNHLTTWKFNSWQERVLHGIVLDDAEFVTWIGFPIILLLLVRLGRGVVAFVRRRASRLDALAITFLVAYVLLVVFGQTNGEVMRLYLFLVPVVALLSADELKTLFKQKKTGFLLLAVLQLVTIVLLFHFQDFYG